MKNQTKQTSHLRRWRKHRFKNPRSRRFLELVRPKELRSERRRRTHFFPSFHFSTTTTPFNNLCLNPSNKVKVLPTPQRNTKHRLRTKTFIRVKKNKYEGTQLRLFLFLGNKQSKQNRTREERDT